MRGHIRKRGYTPPSAESKLQQSVRLLAEAARLVAEQPPSDRHQVSAATRARLEHGTRDAARHANVDPEPLIAQTRKTERERIIDSAERLARLAAGIHGLLSDNLDAEFAALLEDMRGDA